jgi:hypothetical protein
MGGVAGAAPADLGRWRPGRSAADGALLAVVDYADRACRGSLPEPPLPGYGAVVLVTVPDGGLHEVLASHALLLQLWPDAAQDVM